MAVFPSDSNITAKNAFLEENAQIARMPTTQREWAAFIQTLQRWVKDREYAFTLTATGFTNDPNVTSTVTAHRYGKIVFLKFGSITAGSDDTVFTLATLPAELRPAAIQVTPFAQLLDNGTTAAPGEAEIGTDGVITFTLAGNTAFTGSGSKGIVGSSSALIYSLWDAALTK